MADVEKAQEGTGPEDGPLDQPPSQEGSHFGDSSGPLFCMYSNIAEKDDNAMAERWQKDADGVLIFAGLFSAAVATFLSLSIPNLMPNSQDTSNFYLKNIYQHLADPNVSVSSTPSALATPPAFSPPQYVIAVNLLWVFSLGISLSCAIMATMCQQWARQYVRLTQPPRRGPRRRARISALFSGSVDKLLINTVNFLLPCYLHFAVFLFHIGLLVFLFNISNTIFVHTLLFLAFCMLLYLFTTFLPLFQSNSLLYTPFSTLPASFVALLTCLIHSTFADRFKFKTWGVSRWLFEGVGNAVENISLKRSLEMDVRILELTLNSLNEDDAMEKFFGAIPAFFSSRWVNILFTNIPAGLQDVFKEALYEFLDYTFRSTTIAGSVKNSRLIICLDASRAVLGPSGPSWILFNILDGDWPELLRSVETGHSLTSWAYSNDEENALYIRSIISCIIASAEKRNDRWFALASGQPGMSEDLLRHYLAHGDSALLANLINITRLTFCSHFPNWDFHALPSKCDVLTTLPSLQHEFCVLWNEIVLKAQNGNDPIPILILKRIRPVYLALHRDTDASPMGFATLTENNILDRPSSYPLCNIASHRSGSNAVEDAPHTIHSRIQPVLHDSQVLVSGTRPFDMPVPHTTRILADELSFGTASDAPQPHTPIFPSPLLALLDSQPVPTTPHNVAAVDDKQGSTGVSAPPFMANLYPRPIRGDAAASQESESVISPSIVSDAKPVVLQSSADSAMTRSGYISYSQGFASISPPTAPPHISSQVISDLEPHVTTSIKTLHAHDATVDPNMPIPMKISPRPSKSSLSTPDIAVNILRSGDGQQGQNQSKP